MKKIVNHVSIALVSSLFFMACSKTDVPQPPSAEEMEVNGKKPAPIPSKVKTRTAGNDIRTYTYDALGRQTQSVSTTTNSIIHEYDGSIIDYWIYYPGGTSSGVTSAQLNSEGLIGTYTSTNASGNFALSGSYTYNDKKQQVGQEVTFANGDHAVGVFNFQADNLVSAESKVNGVVSWTKTYSYYPNKANTLNNEAFGQPYYGVSSKNLVKSCVFAIAGGATTTEEFKYELDPQGRVAKVKTVKNGVQQPDILYTYY